MPNDPSETNVLHDAAKADAGDGATTAAPANTPTGAPTGVGAYHPGAGSLSDTDEIPTGGVLGEREPASADGYEDTYDDGDDDGSLEGPDVETSTADGASKGAGSAGEEKPGGLGQDGTIPNDPSGVAAGHTGEVSTFEPEEDEGAPA